MPDNKLTLFTSFKEVTANENLNDFQPSHSLIVRFDSAELKEFDPSDVELSHLEEGWFFSQSDCLHIRRSSQSSWLALRISEAKFASEKINQHENASKSIVNHALAGMSLDNKPGWYYEEMLPRLRHYPIEGSPRRAALRCAHYSFEDKSHTGESSVTRHIFRPMDLVNFEEDV